MRRLLVVLLLTLVVAPAAAAKPLPKACTLVGEAKLTSALGREIEHREVATRNGVKMCSWQTPYTTSPFRQVTLEVQPLARDVFTNKWHRKITGVRPVHGVGEMAYSVNNGDWLVAWSDGIEVTVNTTEIGAKLATATLVAKLALAHL